MVSEGQSSQSESIHRSPKRKRHRSLSGAREDGPLYLRPGKDTSGVKIQAARATLAPDTREQYATAGQPLDEDLPRGGFPHHALRTCLSEASITPDNLQGQLRTSKPSVLRNTCQTHSARPPASGLKQSHVAALSQLMHRCLRQSDFIRAGRAFGMLLRTEVRGLQPDIRQQDLWGIGAEILQSINQPTLDSSKDISLSASVAFEHANQFYERLILEFPYRSWHSESLSALHWYPILFCQWISFIDGQHKAAIAAYNQREPDSPTDDDDGLTHEDRFGTGFEELESIRTAALDKAKEIAKRMDEVMQSYPQSDDATLWRMKGQLHLWIADLSSSRTSKDLPGPLGLTLTLRDRSWEGADNGRTAEQQVYNAENAFKKADECTKDSLASPWPPRVDTPSRP